MLLVLERSYTYNSAGDALEGDGARAVGDALALGVRDGLAQGSDGTASRARGGRALSTGRKRSSRDAGNEGEEDGELHVEKGGVSRWEDV